MACKNYDYNCSDCVNAWELERLYSCYEAAHPLTTLKDVKEGDLVEFNQGNERIWGIVVENCYCDLIVIVISELVFEHPFETGDRVLLNIINIYNWVET